MMSATNTTMLIVISQRVADQNFIGTRGIAAAN